MREKKEDKITADNSCKRDGSGAATSAADEKWKRRSLPPGKVQGKIKTLAFIKTNLVN